MFLPASQLAHHLAKLLSGRCPRPCTDVTRYCAQRTSQPSAQLRCPMESLTSTGLLPTRTTKSILPNTFADPLSQRHNHCIYSPWKSVFQPPLALRYAERTARANTHTHTHTLSLSPTLTVTLRHSNSSSFQTPLPKPWAIVLQVVSGAGKMCFPISAWRPFSTRRPKRAHRQHLPPWLLKPRITGRSGAGPEPLPSNPGRARRCLDAILPSGGTPRTDTQVDLQEPRGRTTPAPSPVRPSPFRSSWAVESPGRSKRSVDLDGAGLRAAAFHRVAPTARGSAARRNWVRISRPGHSCPVCSLARTRGRCARGGAEPDNAEAADLRKKMYSV